MLITCHTLQAQASTENQKRLIYFTDKANTPYSLQQPQAYLSAKAVERRQRQGIPLKPRDLPVNPAYITGLKDKGAQVWYSSRWFNAAVVQCSNAKLAELESLPFVKSTRTLNRTSTPATEILKTSQKLEAVAKNPASVTKLEKGDYGRAFHQVNILGATDLHNAGFRGEEMMIAVLDAGFPAVNTINAFAHLFQKNRIKGTFDFVQKQSNVYGANSHGTAVLSTIAAYEPGKIIGTAYEANYLLLRTEDAATEHNIEEINWLLAAEYADSAGADVINSSLGYNTFDSPSRSYTYSEMDGNTTLVARAADIAAAVGMLVVTSAGNEGNSTWKYIASPADADSVLTVGAVDSLGVKASFSSFGPTADGQIKPDVVALGRNAYVLTTSGSIVKSNGTSFSGPIVAGFATALWQANFTKSNYEMIQLIRQIGSQANNPDNNIGYGIPNYNRTLTALPHVLDKNNILITNPVSTKPIVLVLGNDWLKQSLDVQLLDATGKLLYSQHIINPQQEQTLNIQPQALSSGLYLFRVRTGNSITTVRFVKL